MRVHNLLFSAIVTLRSIETSSEITPMNMRDGAPMTRKVDRLLRRRMRSGVAEYLTRWVGYDDESWEPAKALPERMIAAFELQYAADHGHASIPRLLGEGRRELELLEPSPSPKSPSPKPPPSTRTARTAAIAFGRRQISRMSSTMRRRESAVRPVNREAF
ncbi:hypothetical protein EMIHUDRAFT_245930 [Emiliania huxleyi CCMP1516]|uniref:Chromo domain-containing protein n=2 Tax=Emiliania huxleyi TaxID=2903 RepID=A0A0D3IVC9_EMIH1|nr:hypothetical protein EMIHUDRAFT_245930 [Emiliania huxleyi CCMP1516]EOD15214.1 hypothetical protein EMIHUDRAFT_245930 [Emiliania huxleyi CCMP1516]|eukprot:XP_005767643.1 hypothetical protein EMIHUDRAFT_245930 [Emiliania huxleyi CCMP1516]